MKKIDDILIQLVRPCLQNPDALCVEVQPADTISIYHLRVAQCDYGRIIGRNGINIVALKTLFVATGMRRKMTVRIILSENPDDGRRNQRWDREQVREAVADLVDALGYPAGVAVTEHAKNGDLTMLTEAVLPELLHETLARWLLVMGHEGHVRLTLDEPTAA